jgi:protease-4
MKYGIIGIIGLGGRIYPEKMDDFEDALRYELSSKSEAVLLHIRSGGGYVTRVPEMARLIDKVSEQKPVLAYTDTYMASAAYWLGVSADRIYAAPSSCIGSVGAYVETYDFEKYYINQGIEHNVFRAGERKARMLDGQLDDREKAELQAELNETHSEFKAHILARRKIEAQHLEGQAFSGAKALEHGFIDGLADTFHDFETRFNNGEIK